MLAKVLAQKTPILFLDEPTTGLDIVFQEEIFRFCQALGDAGKTVIMVAHELNLAAKILQQAFIGSRRRNSCRRQSGEVLEAGHLSRAYNVGIEVFRNPHSGGIEVTTIPRPEDEERKEALVRPSVLFRAFDD